MCASLAIAAAALFPAGHGTADPISELMDPPHELAAVLPTPLDDPFYVPPGGWLERPLGAALSVRSVASWFLTPVRAVEMLVRSTDTHGRPTPVNATLYVPRDPWTGAGTRPLVSYNIPTSSLGNTCAPSYQLKRGFQGDMVSIQLLLSRGYAVIVPDHQGPRQAYAAGHMGGHAVLDAVRAALHLQLTDLSPRSPVVLSGYSGGGIATGWAAQLAPAYAPELPLAGAVIGGLPADYDLLLKTMDGNAATGVFLAATLGLAREYPELLSLLNDNGWRIAHALRDACVVLQAALGLAAPLPLDRFTDTDPLETPLGRKVVSDNRLGVHTPRAPIFLYHGTGEIWIPLTAVETLYDDWCRGGASVRLQTFPGEHFTVGAMMVPTLSRWVDEIITGTLVPAGCTR
ncbi:lipase family protein [Nocardia yamanashiensis]|uniref:lipase family protein n=1 Tax=Nocardia yamanashiensis TaxID=209247 RepID=UPI000AF2077A|nr:lipase family protein [Nocardia yamanashiensis]